MRTLVVYDSLFGNTERVAHAIGAALEARGSALVQGVEDVPVPDPADYDLLIVGGPTQNHGASPAMRHWLDGLGRRALSGVPAAAFDTRYKMSTLLGGSAAGVVEQRLKKAGCRIVAGHESFFIDRDTPPEGQKRRHEMEYLAAGELDRAAAWAVSLVPPEG